METHHQNVLGLPRLGTLSKPIEMVEEKKKTAKNEYISKRIICELCQTKFNKRETYLKHMKQAHAATSRTDENGMFNLNIESSMTSRKILRSDKTTSRAQNSIN